jgi:SAM-dependent methyltransferase
MNEPFSTGALSAQSRGFWKNRSDSFWLREGEEWFRHAAAELVAMMPHGGTLLDVGCGAGEMLPHLASHFRQVVGLDFSESMLAAAEQRLDTCSIQNVSLLRSDASHFPEGIPSPDAILANGVVQYLDQQALHAHLRECEKVLAPNGVVVWGAIPRLSRRWLWRVGGLNEPQCAGRDMLRLAWRSWLGYRRARATDDALWDGIGRWFTQQDIVELANISGFDVQFRNAWYFDYRFHATFVRK